MIYIKSVVLRKVRNIPFVEIPLSETKRKHLLFTGPNGSGKTTVINELNKYLEGLTSVAAYYDHAVKDAKVSRYEEIFAGENGQTYRNVIAKKESDLISGSTAYMSLKTEEDVYMALLRDKFIICSFDAQRSSKFIEPQGPSKIDRPASSKESIGKYFVQLLVNLRSRKSFANDDGDVETVDKIQKWFDNFDNALSILLGHTDFELQFDTRKFNFTIKEKNKEPYHFSQLSDGYSALLSIVSELMLRMSIEEPLDLYDRQGIVLIDEIENHLHVELQKKVMPFLTSLFPQIQFIVSTHSPFVLSSISDSVIFDLERLERFEDFSEYSYSSIVEDYYGVNQYSDFIVDSIKQIESILQKDVLTEEEIQWIRRIYDSVMNLPETQVVSPELRIKLKELIIKNKSKLHGIL